MKPPPARAPPVKPDHRVDRRIAADDVDRLAQLLSIACDEMLWSARRPPLSCPVSCCGKKPFGTTLNR